MKIKNVKFTFIDSKYESGPYLEFLDFLEVPSVDYDDIVQEIQKSHPEYNTIKIMSFVKS
jgi:hypothetical protein